MVSLTWSVDGLGISWGMMAATTETERKWRLTRMATLAGAVWLSGCVVAPEVTEVTPPVVARPAEPQTAALPPPPRPTRKPAPPVAVTPVEPQEPEAPAESVDPQRIMGLGESDARNWLGEPQQKTEAAPATIWRYTSRDCEIDVYFYLDLQNRVMRALHYEVRSTDIIDRRSERCFQQLVDEHRQREGRTSSAYRPR